MIPRPEQKRYFVQTKPREFKEISVTVLWCMTDDPETNAPHHVGHSFPDSDPDRRHFEETKPVRRKTGNSYGRDVYQDQDEVTTVVEMCGYHWEKVNPFRATKVPAEQPLSLEATRVIDAQKVRDSEQYNKGWEDAARHYDEATGVS